MEAPTIAAPPNTTTLILDSVPKGVHVGIDCSSFSATDSFRGIKLIPAGLHHVWISTTLGLRNGFWLQCTTGTYHYHYDISTESLVKSDEPPILTPELWNHGLTSYRQRLPGGEETPASDAWQGMISGITPEVLTRILGQGWRMETTSASDAEEDDTQDLPLMPGEASEHKIHYTPIDLKKTWPAEAMGRERTEMARDRSWALSQVPDALGEMQTAFVAGFYLGNFASARQWRNIVTLALTSRKAVGDKQDWFVDFLVVLRKQVEVVMEDDGAGFLGDEAMEEVKKLLRGFGKMLREEEEENPSRGRKVRMAFKILAEWAYTKLDWILDTRDILRKGTVQTEEGDILEVQEEGLDEEEETGEYAPAVVMMSRSPSPEPMPIVDDEEEDDPRF
jgi:A1 cistron-splicing factor AAR2